MIETFLPQICEKTGLNEDQAKAALGLVLHLVQERMGADFSKVQSILPEADSLIAAAPKPGAFGGFASSMLGSLGGGKLAGLASLVGAAEKAGITEAQLVGVAQQAAAFLESNGHGELAGLIKELV